MYIERYCRILRYWFKLFSTDNCILKCLYEDMFESSEIFFLNMVFIISGYLSMLTM
jgi:hypothetical protein